jgi:dienelactone hydrolase
MSNLKHKQKIDTKGLSGMSSSSKAANPHEHESWPGRFFAGRVKKARIAGCLIFVFILMAVPGILFITLARAERGVQDQYNRTIGLRKILQNVLLVADVTDIRVCACQPNRVERTVLYDEFETTFAIYDHGGSGPRPGIVLIHGNVWMGQRLSTYRLVAHALAKEGFIVLTFDKIGFGTSDDPFGRGPRAVAAAYDRTSQTDKAIDYLVEHTDVDPNNITLIGHSGGVTQALKLGQRSNRITNSVAWVAPFAPADEEEIEANNTYLSNKFHASYELIYDRSVPDWFTWELTEIEYEHPDIIWQYFQKPEHKPIIIILGEYDAPDAHFSIYERFETLTEPKDLIFVNNADHYLNTAQSLRWVFYDQSIINELVDKLVASLNQEPGDLNTLDN